MGENSKIEWPHHTFNPWRGCRPVSTGCANCYAAALSKRTGGPEYKAGVPRQRTSAACWRQPVKWNRKTFFCTECDNWYSDDWCEACGRTIEEPSRPRVFCGSLCDWLDDEVPIEWLADLLALIHSTPNLDWLLLTKRPENWRERIARVGSHFALKGHGPHEDCGNIIAWMREIAPRNVWLGVTAENQETADARIPELLATPAAVRFVSCEPLLGPVTFDGARLEWLTPFKDTDASLNRTPRVDWIIVGGESGPRARPMHPHWARSLREECAGAGVPFFFKQWGEWKPISESEPPHWLEPLYVPNRIAKEYEDQGALDDCYGRRCLVETRAVQWDGADGYHVIDGHCGYQVFKVGKKKAGRTLDGREWNEWPVPRNNFSIQEGAA